MATSFAGALYVDHDLGTLIEDAFVVPGPWTPWPATCRTPSRARIAEAVQAGAMTHPPLETDTRLVCRPRVEWTVRLLPTGGVGHERPEWDATAPAGITERFLASPSGAGLDDPDSRSLLESLLWFATDYGPGDRPGLTGEVDALEPEYQATICSPRPQGPEALLAGTGLPGLDGPWRGA